jgi:inner membrane protein
VPRRDRHAAALVAAIAVAPDLDLLVGTHRGASHSVGAALIAGAAAWIVLRSPRWAAAAALAWGSHVLLDWLSNDTRPPIGIRALWPVSREYYKSAIEIFPPVSRRYWEARFWVYNLRAVAAELILLGPVAAVVAWRARRAR